MKLLSMLYILHLRLGFLYPAMVLVTLFSIGLQALGAPLLSPEVTDALEQKIVDYKKMVSGKIEESLKSEVFGDLRLVALNPRPDLQKIATEFKKANSVAFSSLPNRISRDQLTLQMIENMKMSQFKRFLLPFQITVTLSSSLSQAQRTLAKSTIESSLGLPRGTELSLKFEDLKFGKSSALVEKAIQEKANLEQDKVNLEQEKQKASEEAARISKDRDTFARDRDFIAGDKRTLDINLKQEQARSLVLSTEVDKLKRLIDDQKKTISSKEDELNIYKTPLGDIKKMIKGLELPLTLFPIFLGLFFSLIVIFAMLSASQKKRAGMMKEGVELMAATLGKLGGKLGGPSAPSTISDAQKIYEREKQDSSTAKSAGQQSFAGASAELIAQEMKNLKSDSESAWMEVLKHPFVMLCILKEWLVEGSTGQERFMCLASTLSPLESANLVSAFHHSLTRNLKNVVTDVNSRLKGYSYVLTLHRSVQDFLLDHPSATPSVQAANIFVVTESQLTKVIFTLSSVQRAAILRLLPTAAWKRILEIAADIYSAEEGAQTLASFANASARLDTKTLETLIQKVNKDLGAALVQEKGDDTSTQIAELAGSLESLSPKLRSVVSFARAKFPEFAAELESRTVTIDHVLKLDRGLLAEFLEPLDSENLAQLIASLEAAKRNSLISLLSAKVKLTAEADFQRFMRSPSAFKRAEVEGQKIQSEFVAKLKKLAAEGIVEIPVLTSGQDLRKGA